MMTKEKYNLTWHSYADNWREIIGEMMETKDFADVTLVCDDMKQIKAHRNILSACSPLLKNILKIDPQNHHPMLFLKGIMHSEMESILQFIYLGEASLCEERMNEFILAVKNLEIRELCKNVALNDSEKITNESVQRLPEVLAECGEENGSEPILEATHNGNEEVSINESTISNSSPTKPNISTELNDANSSTFNCTQCEKDFESESRLKYHKRSQHGGTKYECNQCQYQASHPVKLKYHVKSKHEGGYACKLCEQQYTDKMALKIHIQSFHEGVTYACHHCDSQLSSPSSLRIHIKSVHEGVQYACDQCEYKATQKANLRTHIQSIHEGVKFGCTRCGDQFPFKSGLIAHIKSVHEGVRYDCDQCDFKSTKKVSLIRHIQSKHGQ